MIQIIPSVFATDAGEYKSRFEVAIALARRIHVDVMDGRFVKSKSPPLSTLHKISGQKMEVHLMVESPTYYLEDLKKLGATRVYIHPEVYTKRDKLMEDIFTFKEAKIQVGLALSIKTPISKIKSYLQSIDSVLLMSIKQPGAEGQEFIDDAFSKLLDLRKITQCELGVDGGIKKEMIERLERDGANFVVAGSAIFS